MKKKKIIVFISTVICLTLYSLLFYFYVGNKDKVNLKNDVVTETTTDTMTVDKIISFIDEYKINYLDTFNIFFSDSDEINNQIKLKFVYYSIKETANFSLGVSYTRFESYLKCVFGDNTSLKNEDLLYDNAEKSIYLKYDATNETYIYNEENSNDLNDMYYSRYNYIVSYKNNAGTYRLKVNKFFLKDNKVYSSYGDLISDVNVLFEIPTNVDKKDDYIKEYVNDNYDILKQKFVEYEYIFVKENSSLILKEFEKTN